jgi:hypothetical protein
VFKKEDNAPLPKFLLKVIAFLAIVIMFLSGSLVMITPALTGSKVFSADGTIAVPDTSGGARDRAGAVEEDSHQQKTNCLKHCATICPSANCLTGLSGALAEWQIQISMPIRVGIFTKQTDYTSFLEPPVRPPIV